MQKRVFGLLFLAALACAQAATAQEARPEGPDCAARLLALDKAPDYRAVMNCLVEMQTSIRSLEAEQPEPTIAIPSGAVVAFDRSSGCPNGWQRFEPATSRVIVGAAPEPPNSGAGYSELSERSYREQGGSERLWLGERHIPAHDHALNINTKDKYISRVASDVISDRTPSQAEDGIQIGAWSKWLFSGEGGDPNFTLGARYRWSADTYSFGHSGETGEGEPLAAMPPYVALFVCRKQ